MFALRWIPPGSFISPPTGRAIVIFLLLLLLQSVLLLLVSLDRIKFNFNQYRTSSGSDGSFLRPTLLLPRLLLDTNPSLLERNWAQKRRNQKIDELFLSLCPAWWILTYFKSSLFLSSTLIVWPVAGQWLLLLLVAIIKRSSERHVSLAII